MTTEWITQNGVHLVAVKAHVGGWHDWEQNFETI